MQRTSLKVLWKKLSGTRLSHVGLGARLHAGWLGSANVHKSLEDRNFVQNGAGVSGHFRPSSLERTRARTVCFKN
jgi:hypothetical protein